MALLALLYRHHLGLLNGSTLLYQMDIVSLQQYAVVIMM